MEKVSLGSMKIRNSPSYVLYGVAFQKVYSTMGLPETYMLVMGLCRYF